MRMEIAVALIGAFSTIVVALIGAFVTLQTHPAAEPVAAPGAAPQAPAAAANAAAANAGRRKKTYAVVTLAVVLAAVIIVLGVMAAEKMDRQLTSYKKLVTDGIAKNKPYVIPGLLMLIQLDKTPDGKTLDSTRHIFYEIHTLKDIEHTQPGFNEDYHSKLGTLDYIPGADREVLRETTASMKAWDIFFDNKAGERRILLTGAHVATPMPLNENHDIHMFQGLTPNEDAFCYPNEDGDVIGEAVIVVESRTLDLYLPPGDDALLVHGDEHKRGDASQYTYPGKGDVHTTIVARFHNLQDKDIAGLKVAWR